jgi:hypothetical protein
MTWECAASECLTIAVEDERLQISGGVHTHRLPPAAAHDPYALLLKRSMLWLVS